MRIPKLALVASLLVTMVGTSACGGGGNPFSISGQDITMSGAVLPQALSGQSVNYVIPIDGGCGGPYVMAVIAGSLPPGLSLDNATHSIQGIVLLPGNYAFTLQIDDTGCTPFATTTRAFTWDIGVGPVAIVACDPPIIPVAEYAPPFTTPFADVDALKTTVYGGLATFNFTIAGGIGPYTLDVIDDPNDPADSNWGPIALPQGMSIPPFSASLVGSPSQTGGSIPFRLTFRVIDSQNTVGYRKLQWKVDTPPIIIATTVLPNGKCGTVYSESVQIVDGVPPFEFELVEQPATVDVWQSPLAPLLLPATITVSQVNGRASNKLDAGDYPGQAVVGPYVGIVPEGVALTELAGVLNGVPRREGTFTFHLHVTSRLVPNDFGQHAWQTFSNVVFANSEPPVVPTPAFGFGSLSTWTVEGVLLPAAPYSTLPELERGVPYNPDGGTSGLSFIAQGGVKKDGKTDAPHTSQVSNIDGTLPPPVQEFGGGYDWTVDWDPLLTGVTPPVGVLFTGHTGVLSVPVPSLLGSRGRTVMGFTVFDQQLPTGSRHSTSGRVAYAIGPDRVIITTSSVSEASILPAASKNDHEQTVSVLEPLSSGAVFRQLQDSTDLTPQGLPSTTSASSAADLLTSVDLMRVSINPTGWWDDVHGLNPASARAAQGSDPNKGYPYYNGAYDDGTSRPYNTNASHVRLPSATGVAANAANGVYVDGGKLYGFESETAFGVFIVRSNSLIYVPVAIDKSSGFSGFGDGVLQPHPGTGGTPVHSGQRIAQMTISPNGRFAAMKLKTNNDTGQAAFAEDASSTRIILFSLTGEAAFGGSTYEIIETGSDGSQNMGVYQYASSLALTNSYLYYLCGNHLTEFSSWREHGVYRYTITSGAGTGALLAPNAYAGWKNDGSSPSSLMQTPFQAMDSPTSFSSVWNPQTQGFSTVELFSQEMYAFDGWNVVENAVAPMPFRVSRDGRACAILAGNETGNPYADVNNMNHQVWVDMSGTLRQLTSVRRHSPQGGSRGYTLSRGPSNYKHWGAFCGPTTGFEIADDASKVAVVVNRQTSAVDPQSYIWYGNYNWRFSRQDVVAFTTTDSWASTTTVQVTGTESATSPRFGGTYYWRFGALTFTSDNAGLIFWGGYNSQFNPPPALNQDNSAQLSGTFYSWNFSTSTLSSILPASAGGGSLGVATMSGTYNPTFTKLSSNKGCVRPVGGFISRNRSFLYISSFGGVSGSDRQNTGLIGINIRSLNAAQSINTRPDGQGFKVAGQVSTRGFLPVYDVDPYYVFEQRTYAPANSGGFGGQVMARDSGYVFFASHYQPYAGVSQGFAYQSPTFMTQAGPEYTSSYYDIGVWQGQVEGFSADVAGPVARMTQTSLTQTDNTTSRPMHHIVCTDDGAALAFVYDTGGNSQTTSSAEAIGFIQRIGFNASTGTLLTGKVEWNPTTLTNGRAGDSLAIDSQGTTLYAAFGTSANENGMNIRTVRFSGSGSGTFTVSTLGSVQRYNVLHSGR